MQKGNTTILVSKNEGQDGRLDEVSGVYETVCSDGLGGWDITRTKVSWNRSDQKQAEARMGVR